MKFKTIILSLLVFAFVATTAQAQQAPIKKSRHQTSPTTETVRKGKKANTVARKQRFLKKRNQRKIAQRKMTQRKRGAKANKYKTVKMHRKTQKVRKARKVRNTPVQRKRIRKAATH